jgi:hypothetical protein
MRIVLSIAGQNVKDWKLNNKVTLKLLEAKDIRTLDKKFDIIMTTWFTPGNFYPVNFNFSSYDPGDKKVFIKK